MADASIVVWQAATRKSRSAQNQFTPPSLAKFDCYCRPSRILHGGTEGAERKSREMGAGSGEQGAGRAEQGAGSGEQGAGSREMGLGSRPFALRSLAFEARSRRVTRTANVFSLNASATIQSPAATSKLSWFWGELFGTGADLRWATLIVATRLSIWATCRQAGRINVSLSG